MQTSCPHFSRMAHARMSRTYMKKKPKKYFLEYKNVADVDSGVMLQLELRKGAAVVSFNPYVRQHGHHVPQSLCPLSGAGLLLQVVSADCNLYGVHTVVLNGFGQLAKEEVHV